MTRYRLTLDYTAAPNARLWNVSDAVELLLPLCLADLKEGRVTRFTSRKLEGGLPDLSGGEEIDIKTVMAS